MRGIVLDAETAEVVPEGSTVQVPGGFAGRTGSVPPFSGSVLTHIGGRPVAELVAAHDKARAKAEALRADARHFGHFDSMSSRLHAAADHLDRCADLLIDPRLVAAWHEQG